MIPTFNDIKDEAFGKQCRKRRKIEIAGKHPSFAMFSTLLQRSLSFLEANSYCLVQSKILLFGKELSHKFAGTQSRGYSFSRKAWIC